MLKFEVHENLHEEQDKTDVRNFLGRNLFKKQNKYLYFCELCLVSASKYPYIVPVIIFEFLY